VTTPFGAPLGWEVKVMTGIFALIISGPVLLLYGRGFPPLASTLVLVPMVIIALLCVRGYELAPGELRIQRLFWQTRWPLDTGTRARVRPHAMKGSWRTWGNGGVFAFSGHFSGSGLGRYRAFVIDPSRTVVLETAKGIVVVSPDRPEEFVEAVVACSASRS
jgi:hypothetical protein